jgi:3-phosphoshikimate 1-carboxyvinyltransferase
MRPAVFKKAFSVSGIFTLPGDKSISHRAVILGAIANGRTTVKNFPFNKDCLATVHILQKLGVTVALEPRGFGSGIVRVAGCGLHGLRQPGASLVVQESGTTFRLMLGLLAGQGFSVILKAGEPLKKRPMLRVTGPLRLMGARIEAVRLSKGAEEEEYPPVRIIGAALQQVSYTMPVASAQVKSALLLAGLYASGKTTVIEPVHTRDHTERMLRLFRADIAVSKKLTAAVITVGGKKELVAPGVISVPGDISSAAFFIVLASLVPGSKIRIKNVSLNPSRMGIIGVLKRMKAGVQLKRFPRKLSSSGEPSGDILASFSRLTGVVVKKREIPLLIDELPVLMVAACFAHGETVLEGVGELRVKETDRIRSMTENLKKMGAVIDIRATAEGENIVIKGGNGLDGARVKSFGDHRTAMSLIVAGLSARGRTRIDDVSCIEKSFPGFLRLLRKILVP